MFSYFAAFMLIVYVVILPLAALIWLKGNRPSGKLVSPRELAVLDGALAPLTTKYAQTFWWFESVGVFTRLCFCGLAVFLFPTKSGLRCTFCLLVNTCYIVFVVAFKPVALESCRHVDLIAHALLWLVAASAGTAQDVASESVQVAYSTALFLFTIGACALVHYLKAAEPQLAMVTAITKGEPFEIKEFEALEATRSGAFLHEAVVRAARKIAMSPTAKDMAFLRTQLLPLKSVWCEQLPAPLVLKERAEAIEQRLRAYNFKHNSPTIAKQLDHLFGDVVELGDVVGTLALTPDLLAERAGPGGNQFAHIPP